MKIQILRTGCANCRELEMRLAEAVAKSGWTDVPVERVDATGQRPTYSRYENLVRSVEIGSRLNV
jgi:hypothetical protein